MSNDDFWTNRSTDWRSETDQPAIDFDALDRRILEQRVRVTAWTRLELAGCGVAAAVCVWAIMQGKPAGLVLGIAGLAFALFGLAVTLGRDRTPGALEARTVAAALRWELDAARSAVRRTIGSLFVAVGALVFLALCAVMFQRQGDLAESGSAGYALMAALAYTLGAGLLSVWFLVRRRDRARRLAALLTDLTDENEAA